MVMVASRSICSHHPGPGPRRPPTPPPGQTRGRHGSRAGVRRRSVDRPAATSWSSTRRDRRHVRDRRSSCPMPSMQSAPSATAAARSANTGPGLMHPRTPIGVRQHRGDLRRQAGQIGDLPQHPDPGMRHHTLAVRGHFHPGNCCDILHLRSAFPPASWNRREVPLCLAGQALSLIYTPHHAEFREKSRLAVMSVVQNRRCDRLHRNEQMQRINR